MNTKNTGAKNTDSKKPMSSIKGVQKYLCQGSCGQQTTNPGKVCGKCLTRFEAAQKALATMRLLHTGREARQVVAASARGRICQGRKGMHQSRWSTQS